MAVPYKHPRGTLSALNALAGSSGLILGQIYYLTDIKRIAIADSASSYVQYAKLSEIPLQNLSKTINYTSSKISSIQYYTDSAKTQLYRTMIFNRTGTQLTSVEVRDSSNTLLNTKTISYAGTSISGVTIT